MSDFTLSEVLQEFHTRMGQLNSGVATGGDAAQILDTFRNGQGRDKGWRGGSAFITQTTDGLAPQGEMSRVNASIASTWALTLSPVLSAAVEAGDIYAFTGPEYPLYDSIAFVNSGLRKLGMMEYVDKTTLVTVTSESELVGSSEWKRPWGPTRVDIAANDDDLDNQWHEDVTFEWEPAVADEGGRIIFPDYPQYDGAAVRVWYKGEHPRVGNFNSVIDGRLDPEVVLQAVISAGLDWNNTRIRGGDKFLIKRQNKAETDLGLAKAEEPTVKQGIGAKLLCISGFRRRYPGDRNPT